MFTLLPGRLSPGLRPESVVAIIESINTPNVSIPEVGTEPAKGYLIGFATPGGGYGIVCYLLMLESNLPIIYLSNPPEVPIEMYGDLEGAAIQFAESMGLMLDNMNFRALAPDAQRRLAEQLPFFRDQHPRMRERAPVHAANASHAPHPAAPAAPQPRSPSQIVAGASPSDLPHVARLLSSF